MTMTHLNSVLENRFILSVLGGFTCEQESVQFMYTQVLDRKYGFQDFLSLSMCNEVSSCVPGRHQTYNPPASAFQYSNFRSMPSYLARIYLFIFEMKSLVTYTNLKLTVQLKLALNSRFSCLQTLSAGITGVGQYTRLGLIFKQCCLKTFLVK